MAIIKNFTSLKQSKKLAKILPLESADMIWVLANPDLPIIKAIAYKDSEKSKYYEILPAWSLASLLNVIPKDESIDCSISFGYYNGKGEYIAKWLCTFEKENETKDGFIIETIDGDNSIDVLYEMILELNKLKML